MYQKVVLQNQKRYQEEVNIPREKLEQAFARALKRLEQNAEKFGDKMVVPVNGWYTGNHQVNRNYQYTSHRDQPQ